MLFRLPQFSSVTENHAQYMVRLINICCMSKDIPYVGVQEVSEM